MTYGCRRGPDAGVYGDTRYLLSSKMQCEDIYIEDFVNHGTVKQLLGLWNSCSYRGSARNGSDLHACMHELRYELLCTLAMRTE